MEIREMTVKMMTIGLEKFELEGFQWKRGRNQWAQDIREQASEKMRDAH